MRLHCELSVRSFRKIEPTIVYSIPVPPPLCASYGVNEYVVWYEVRTPYICARRFFEKPVGVGLMA